MPQAPAHAANTRTRHISKRLTQLFIFHITRSLLAVARTIAPNPSPSRFLQIFDRIWFYGLPAPKQQLQEHPLGFELVFGHRPRVDLKVLQILVLDISCANLRSTFILTKTEASILRKVWNRKVRVGATTPPFLAATRR
jgi:hypothetical protein